MRPRIVASIFSYDSCPQHAAESTVPKGTDLVKLEGNYADERPRSRPSIMLFFRRHKNASQFLTFLAVGILNTAFGYGVFAGLYLLGGSHRVSIVIATGFGVVFNYFTMGRLVFTGF